ncbi:class I SAM-dependent methyltransferase [Mycobacterium sp. CPCC 205372]|uniref:Class I SAM-dependent methyltransferase n=1 Tax=Mycobacterium hippophais TaxID=3016340 RepID=A0ABT4PS41_9MYCO|nr:class I SAM-dependent methyltransferase [Mycobacterium hippophais]MCZ8379355.1 class I SAM-dependent methyltransferase [Mycobacterium hippophais]
MGKAGGDTLQGVSETTLWTLHNRASEAMRADRLIDDPLAVSIFESIDFDFRKFGPPTLYHPLRARAFDTELGKYLADHPRAAVVALAEGLQTTFWRVDNGQLTWHSVDLPPVIELRRQLLPQEPRIRTVAQSAFDLSWMDEVEATDGVFITVEGLFMYLEPEQVYGLIGACAARFPGGRMIFDNHPPWMSRRAQHGFRLSERYTTPPMPFSLSYEDAQAMTSIPGVAGVDDIDLPAGRGIWRVIDKGASRQTRPALTLLHFG